MHSQGTGADKTLNNTQLWLTFCRHVVRVSLSMSEFLVIKFIVLKLAGSSSSERLWRHTTKHRLWSVKQTLYPIRCTPPFNWQQIIQCDLQYMAPALFKLSLRYIIDCFDVSNSNSNRRTSKQLYGFLVNDIPLLGSKINDMYLYNTLFTTTTAITSYCLANWPLANFIGVTPIDIWELLEQHLL